MGAKKGAGFQRPWLHSGRVRGGITQCRAMQQQSSAVGLG